MFLLEAGTSKEWSVDVDVASSFTGFDVDDICGSSSVGVLARLVVANRSSLSVCITSCIEDSSIGVASATTP